jgi:hypothetical protein
MDWSQLHKQMSSVCVSTNKLNNLVTNTDTFRSLSSLQLPTNLCVQIPNKDRKASQQCGQMRRSCRTNHSLYKSSPQNIHHDQMWESETSQSGKTLDVLISFTIQYLGARVNVFGGEHISRYKNCISTYQSIDQSTNQQTKQSSTLPTYLLTHLPIHPPTHPPTYLPTYLSVCLPTYISSYLSIHSFIYLSI